MTTSTLAQQAVAYVEIVGDAIDDRLKPLPPSTLLHAELGPVWLHRTVLTLASGEALSPTDAAALARLLKAHFIDGDAPLTPLVPKGRPPEQRISLDDVFNAKATAGSIGKATALLAKQRGMTAPTAKQAYNRARRAAIDDAVKELREGRGVRPLDDAAIEAMIALDAQILPPLEVAKLRACIVGWNDIAREAWAIVNKDSA